MKRNTKDQDEWNQLYNANGWANEAEYKRFLKATAIAFGLTIATMTLFLTIYINLIK
jgi:hypothetical protein